MAPLCGGYTSTRSPHARTGSAGGCYGRQNVLHTISSLSHVNLHGVCPFVFGQKHTLGLFFFFLWLSQGPSWSTGALPGVFSPLLHGCATCAPIATPVGLRHLLVLPLVMSIRDHRQQNQFNNNGCLARRLSILPAVCSTCTSAD